jgi:stringent starvation protein B
MSQPPGIPVPPRSRRPYLIRAIYQWTLDCGFTPYLVVAADQPGVQVPKAFVKDGRIALDIGPMAVRDLNLDYDPLFFSARFGGAAQEIVVPSGAVLAIYARENGEGLMFGEPEATPESQPPEPPPEAPKPGGRPKLRVIK